MREADRALYAAKRAGRNTVKGAGALREGPGPFAAVPEDPETLLANPR